MPHTMTIGEWMTRNPVTIDAGATIIEAVHLLKEKNIRRVPVMKGGRVVGLLTERMIKDFMPSKATSLDRWEIYSILSKTTVTEAMNPHPLHVKETDKLTDVAQEIIDHKLNGILVTDDAGELRGIFTTTDALRALIELARRYAAGA